MSNFNVMESNLVESFNKVKLDVNTLSSFAEEHRGMVKTLHSNQRKLLEKIQALEAELVKKKPIPNANGNTYVGAATSMVLHHTVCPYSKNIKPKNKVIFKTKRKAKNQGYRLCDCLKRG